MDRINEWIELTDNKLTVNDVYIHPDHLMMLDISELKGWIIRKEHVHNYYEYYPIKTTCNGIRFACIYVNINTNSKEFGLLFRLTSHVSGEVDFMELNHQPYIDELTREYAPKP